jgi:hypothetical protein
VLRHGETQAAGPACGRAAGYSSASAELVTSPELSIDVPTIQIGGRELKLEACMQKMVLNIETLEH